MEATTTVVPNRSVRGVVPELDDDTVLELDDRLAETGDRVGPVAMKVAVDGEEGDPPKDGAGAPPLLLTVLMQVSTLPCPDVKQQI